MTNKVEKFPAPWNLKGKGYIIVYALDKDFVEKEGNVPEFLKGKFVGGFGALMLVDYEESNAGPYGEMLFIPGKFKFKNKRLDTISKIYVSTMESVVNGRNNWGIPKERADFKFTKIDENRENVCISLEGENIAELVEKAITKAYIKVKNQVSMPGFRKGKVPQKMIEKQYGVEVFYEDAADFLIQDSYEEAYDEAIKEIEIVSQPKIEDITIKRGENFVYVAQVAVKPVVTLGEYKGIEYTAADLTLN